MFEEREAPETKTKKTRLVSMVGYKGTVGEQMEIKVYSDSIQEQELEQLETKTWKQYMKEQEVKEAQQFEQGFASYLESKGAGLIQQSRVLEVRE